MKTINLKPAPGRECPMPHNPRELLPAGGAPVPRNAYWERRISDGDAVEQKASSKPKGSTAE